MEGDAGRGFERLLRRLDAATRARHCGITLEEELGGVLAQFRQCAQAMDHARQVDEATKSLIPNAATGPRVRLGSAAIAQHLSELKQLEADMNKALVALMEVAKDRLVALPPAENVTQVEVKIENLAETPSEEMQLLERMRALLTEQHGGTWLRDALEAARSVVRALDAQETAGANAGREDFSAEEQRIFEPFKLLRKAVLKHVTTHPEEVATFRKLLKRLMKKRPVFSVFVDRFEQLLSDKQAKAAKKPTEEAKKSREEPKKSKEETKVSSKKPSDNEPSGSKPKKRKLSDSSEPPKLAPAASQGASAVSDIRSKAQLCSAKAQALGDVFSLSAFDVCLKLMIDVVNALTPQFTGDDTAMVSATLFVLVEAVDKVKVQDKRRDRLVCLESLLTVLLTKERIPWNNARTKKTAQDHLERCRSSIEALRRHEFSAASTPMAGASTSSKSVPSAPVKKKKKKEKPAPSHKRFDED